MAEVTMPKLSDTMEEGKILRWLKHAGDHVEVGDLLVEVETDKADMEVESSAAGVLSEVKLGEGESAPVGAVIAVIDGGAGAAKKPAAESRREASAAAAEAAPPRKSPPRPAEGAKEPRVASAPAPRAAAPLPAAHQAAPRTAADVKASPLARSLAEELGVDLATVRGTGPAGRVTRRDVEEAHAGGAGTGAAPHATRGNGAAPREAPAARGRDGRAAQRPRADAAQVEDAGAGSTPAAGVRRVPFTRMRASIAKRMAESKREAPHFYLTTVVDMDEAVRLRAQLKALAVSSEGVTYNHMVLKAVADALREFPEVNARYAGDAVDILDEVNVGIATAVDEGLIVPVLQGADRLSLLEIAAAARALVEKTDGGRFSSAELSGATFSVSNLGMYDVDHFSAVINPPQSAILAVGSVKQRPVVRDGALAVGYTMALTLSCDHRVIDGALGGRFLAGVKRRLENPASLLLDGGRSR